MMDRPGHGDALTAPRGDRHDQGVQHQGQAVMPGGPPPDDHPGERVDDQRGVDAGRAGAEPAS